jgi:hypothetical protein
LSGAQQLTLVRWQSMIATATSSQEHYPSINPVDNP